MIALQSIVFFGFQFVFTNRRKGCSSYCICTSIYFVVRIFETTKDGEVFVCFLKKCAHLCMRLPNVDARWKFDSCILLATLIFKSPKTQSKTDPNRTHTAVTASQCWSVLWACTFFLAHFPVFCYSFDNIMYFIEGHLLDNLCIAFKQYHIEHIQTASQFSRLVCSLSRCHTAFFDYIQCIRSSVSFPILLPKIHAHTHNCINKHATCSVVFHYTHACFCCFPGYFRLTQCDPSLHTWTNNLKISNTTFGFSLSFFLSMPLQHMSDTLYMCMVSGVALKPVSVILNIRHARVQTHTQINFRIVVWYDTKVNSMMIAYEIAHNSFKCNFPPICHVSRMKGFTDWLFHVYSLKSIDENFHSLLLTWLYTLQCNLT